MGLRALVRVLESDGSRGATKNGLNPVVVGVKSELKERVVVWLLIREAGWAKAAPERSGIREPAQVLREVESMSASNAREVRGQVKGSPAPPVGWLRRKRAFKSKGINSELGDSPTPPLNRGADLTKDKREALTANPERRADSLAVTGLIQPWSSVEPKEVLPPLTMASGPVHSTCWVEGEAGPRR